MQRITPTRRPITKDILIQNHERGFNGCDPEFIGRTLYLSDLGIGLSEEQGSNDKGGNHIASLSDLFQLKCKQVIRLSREVRARLK